jgi:ATP-dependent DNA helicase RecG
MMDIDRLMESIAGGEALSREFKSEKKRFPDGRFEQKQLSDNEICEEVVAMANWEGGTVLIGVEDDGTVTGAVPRHGHTTNTTKLQTMIFNKTIPHTDTSVAVVDHSDGQVIVIEVEPCGGTCATSAGKATKRVMGGDGQPATVPFYPHEQVSRRTDLGLMDYSAQVLQAADFDSLDPLEFERVRQTIARLRGDQKLLELDDRELAQAMRLVETRAGDLVPNIAGILLLGRQQVLSSLLPTHEVRFQVLDSAGNVNTNEVFHGPLLAAFDEVAARFAARNEEQEVLVGALRLRMAIPDYSPDGFREALTNAVVHRDYSQLGTVYVQWQPDHLLITNPGGFPEGISVENILVHEPKPRNPRLADAFRRIGLVEQTGRGVDRIFMEQLRYGRPAPDYTRTDIHGVRLVLHGGQPSLEFAAVVHEEDQRGQRGSLLPLDELMVLNELFLKRRIDSTTAGILIQKGGAEGHSILERLHERGLVEPRGETRGRIYHMSASLYERLGIPEAYVRTRGFDRIQQRQMVLTSLDAAPDGRITNKEVVQLCRLTSPQAYRLLRDMCEKGDLEAHKKGRGAYYTRKRTG